MKNWLTGLMVLALLTADVDAGKPSGSGSSGSSGRSYSSGRSLTPSFGHSSTFSSAPKSAPPASSGKSFSSGPPKSTPPASSPTPSGKQFTSGPPKTGPPAVGRPADNSHKPTSQGWNPGLSGAKAREQSKSAYQSTRPAEKPAATFKSSTGVVKPINPTSPQVTTVRSYVTHERYITYDNRSTVFYGPSIYAHPAYYNDFYSPFLFGYLFSSAVNANERAMWLYSHRYEQGFDQQRYNDMIARDADLRVRIAQLERDKVAQNPAYVPASMAQNPDLMYNKDFVTAVYNPQAVPTPPEQHHSGVGAFFFWFFMVIIALLAVWLVVYLFCIKDYGH